MGYVWLRVCLEKAIYVQSITVFWLAAVEQTIFPVWVTQLYGGFMIFLP